MDRRSVLRIRWARAGVFGAALGPAVGGVLTQLARLGVDLPRPGAARAGSASPRLRSAPPHAAGERSAGRPHVPANLALLFGSAALSAALFLLVVLLVNGWNLDPAAAGVVAPSCPPQPSPSRASRGALGSSHALRAVTGLLLVAGGLAGLGVLPHAGWAWTIAPQVLVGAGLGLTVAALTRRGSAAAARRRRSTAAGRSRRATRGVVLGLLLLTPLFTAQLDRNETEAKRAGAAILLDSRVPPLDKLRVAEDVLRTIDRADGRLPDVRSAFQGRFDGPTAPSTGASPAGSRISSNAR